MKQTRQIYLLKVWRDTEQHMRLELRDQNGNQVLQFLSVADLGCHLEDINPPAPKRKNAKGNHENTNTTQLACFGIVACHHPGGLSRHPKL